MADHTRVLYVLLALVAASLATATVAVGGAVAGDAGVASLQENETMAGNESMQANETMTGDDSMDGNDSMTDDDMSENDSMTDDDMSENDSMANDSMEGDENMDDGGGGMDLTTMGLLVGGLALVGGVGYVVFARS